MYFPLLRGRQFELLALRELLENDRISADIIPIVEPIKLSSTLLSVLEIFVNKKRKISLVINPKVGDFQNELYRAQESDKVEFFERLLQSEYIVYSYWAERKLKINDNKEFILINTNRDSLDECEEILSNYKPSYVLIPDDRSFKRTVKDNRVLIEDSFVKREKNSDYSANQDEFFSDINIAYQEEGFVGFSDYSIIGQAFMDSGFAPMAVAIHIVYLNEKEEIRIRHFVSNSNFDINDPAGKFSEALKKLVNWVDNNKIKNTLGLEQFKKCYDLKRYPGLGTVKKFSIMHHLELISDFLRRKNENRYK